MRMVAAVQLAGLVEQFLLDLLHGLRGIGGRVRAALRRPCLVLQQGQCRQQVGRRDVRNRGSRPLRILARGTLAARRRRRVAACKKTAHGVVQLDLKLRGHRIVLRGVRCITAFRGYLAFRRRRRAGLLRHGWWARTARRGAGDDMPDLRQYAGLDQLRADFLVQRIQPGQDIAIEQLVDDQLRLQVQVQLAHRDAEPLAQLRGAYRIGRILDFGASAQHRQALVHRVQRPREATVVLGHRAGDGQGLFQFAVFDQ